MPGLESGSYQIVAKVSGQSVGRRLAEDKSFNPKRVVVLPEGMDPEVWTFKKVSEDQFILKARDAPTANIDNQVFAVLLETPPPTYWIILPEFGQGPDIYTIAYASDPTQVWVVPSEEDNTDQILIRPAPNNPARLFTITSAN